MLNKNKPFSLHLNPDLFLPATAADKEYITQMRPSTTFFKDGMKRLLRNKVATVSMLIIVLVTIACIVLPSVWPYSYDQMLGQTKGRPMDRSYNNLAPFEYGKTELSKIEKGESVFPHIFGTDSHGRDYFIRVVYGTRISLAVGFFASIIVLIIGLTIGSIAGYFGGKIDLFMERFSEILGAVPTMIVITLLKYHMGSSSQALVLFIAFFATGWIGMAGRTRMQFYRFKNQEYVLAARTLGARDMRIMFKHIFPNGLGTIVTSVALVIPSMIYSETSLSYLGIINLEAGNTTSVGTLIAAGKASITANAGYVALFPCVFLVLLMLSFNLFGNGLRDAFNPSLRGTED